MDGGGDDDDDDCGLRGEDEQSRASSPSCIRILIDDFNIPRGLCLPCFPTSDIVVAIDDEVGHRTTDFLGGNCQMTSFSSTSTTWDKVPH